MMQKKESEKYGQGRLICLILACLMVYTVSGCAGKSVSQEIVPTTAAAAAKTQETTAAVTVPPATSAAKVTAAVTEAPATAPATTAPEAVSSEQTEAETETEIPEESAGEEKKPNKIIDTTQFHPSIYITADQPIVSKETYVDCTLTVEGTDEEYEFQDVPAQIRVRGNSSALNTDRLPYKIKFIEKNNLLGLHDGKTFKTWVLLNDNDGICANYLIYKVGKALFGDNYFVTDAALVDVYLNGEYVGLYTACEQTQIKKNRVNVTEAVTGSENGDRIGYLIELDNYAELDDPMFFMNNSALTIKDFEGNQVQALDKVYTLKNDQVSSKQLEFISKYMNSIYRLIYAATYENTAYKFDVRYDLVTSSKLTPEQAIRNVIDIDSAVDMYLLEEITTNRDKGNGSFYFAVDFSKDAVYPKVTFMPPWDLAWCNYNAEGYYAATVNTNKDGVESDNEWLIMLMNNDWFREEVANRVKELAQSGEVDDAFAKIRTYMESYYPEINSGQQEDAEIRMAFYYKRYQWVLSNFAK